MQDTAIEKSLPPSLLSEIEQRGLVLLGCGKMGSALLQGWLRSGLPANAVYVIDPAPPAWLSEAGCNVNAALPASPAIMLLAIKPQLAEQAISQLSLSDAGPRTLAISIMAGLSLSWLEARLGAAPIIRVMPNTPAAVGAGISAMIGNAHSNEAHLAHAEALLRGVGAVLRLDDEAQMDAVTAVSGSGPAYVFHLIETLAEAGRQEGLPPEMALALARQTVAGAGALAAQSGEDPATLRQNVTSPGGTTAAGLAQLMDAKAGLAPLMARTVRAARRRSEELGNG